ncbi:MAG: transcription antitermination factor NusB, partial [Azoarcus sp.]|nr:transcription antitermination factor NusB [Azoarcus sp.]
ADREFFVATLRGVIGQQEALSPRIAAHIDRPFNELSPIESCVLMLGCFEMLNHPETPYRVIINEAIELTKTFGGTDGHKYVNGVLDKVAAVVRPDEVAARTKK